jgi:hypothetical protein
MKISIPNPCSEDWNQMTASEKGRFCTSCQTQVINFTEMPVEEIKHFLEQETESICGRFSIHQIELFNATYQELPSPSNLRKWTIAAVIAGVSVLPAFAQGSNFMHLHPSPNTSSSYHNQAQTTDTVPVSHTIVLTGQVIDSEINERMIGAAITVKGTQITTSTDIDGNFRLAIPKSKETITLEVHYLGYVSLSHNIVPDSTPIHLVLNINEDHTIVGNIFISKKQRRANKRTHKKELREARKKERAALKEQKS